MSYFDSLSSWQQAGQTIQQQQQDNEQEQRNSKAQGINEKFDFVDKILGESGGGLTGLGGGFHIGVRMYRKGQKKVSDAKKMFEEAKAKLTGNGTQQEPDGQGSKTPDEHTSQPNGQEDQQISKGKGKAKANEEPNNNDTSNDPAPEPPKADGSAGDAGGEGGGSVAPPAGSEELKQQTTKPDTDTDLADQHGYADKVIGNNQKTVDDVFSSPADKELAQNHIDAQMDFKENNPLPSDGKTVKPSEANNPAPEPPTGPKPPNEFPEAPKPPAPEQTGVVKSADGGDRVGNLEQTAQAPESKTGIGESGSTEITTSGADESGSVVENLSTKASSFVDKAKGTVSNTMDKVADLKSGAGQVLKDGVEKMAGEAGSKALEVGSGVLDFLGPVGELVGAGLALGSFFHDLFDKKKMEKKQASAQASVSTSIPSAGGISTTSMASAGDKSNMVGTLV